MRNFVWAAPLPFLVLAACANPAETDAGSDDAAIRDLGFVTPDTGAPDTGTADTGESERDAGLDAGDPPDEDGGFPDSGAPDAGFQDSGPRVIPIVVAYSATAEVPLLAELYLTESSTTRAKVTPVLAGGPTTDSKGDPLVSGVQTFEWTRDASGIFYSAQQETYDRYEIYLAPDPGSGRNVKLSAPGVSSQTYYWYRFPSSNWIVYSQTPAGQTRDYLYAVRTATNAQSVQITFGSSSVPFLSPVSEELVTQDILVSASDRDLWHVNLAVSPPVRTRVNPGANLGFGNTAAWSPDGTRIAYNADETALRLFELFQVSVTNGVLGPRQRVTAQFPPNADVLGEGTIKYAPRGSRLAFIADTDTENLEELFILDPSSPLPVVPIKVNGSFPPGADGVDRFTFSEDGTRIAYIADHDTPGLQDLYVTDLTGANTHRINAVLGANASISHESFIRNDTMMIYSQWDGARRRVYVVDVSVDPPGAPIDLGPVQGFFPSPRFGLSPSGDYLIHPDQESPPSLHISVLTGTPTTAATLPALDIPFNFEQNWCWGPNDELLIVGPDGHLYLVEDLRTGAVFQVSGPMIPEGRVTSCAFPP